MTDLSPPFPAERTPFHCQKQVVRRPAANADACAAPGADRIREGAETFVVLRRKHPAVESAINTLEHRGLDRVRAHGAGGFERVVGLSVLAFNIHRLGLLLRRRRQVLRKRQRLPLAA